LPALSKPAEVGRQGLRRFVGIWAEKSYIGDYLILEALKSDHDI
jgi:hypothetical protein